MIIFKIRSNLAIILLSTQHNYIPYFVINWWDASTVDMRIFI